MMSNFHVGQYDYYLIFVDKFNTWLDIWKYTHMLFIEF